MSPNDFFRSTHPLPGKRGRYWTWISRSGIFGAGWLRERNICISMDKRKICRSTAGAAWLKWSRQLLCIYYAILVLHFFRREYKIVYSIFPRHNLCGCLIHSGKSMFYWCIDIKTTHNLWYNKMTTTTFRLGSSLGNQIFPKPVEFLHMRYSSSYCCWYFRENLFRFLNSKHKDQAVSKNTYYRFPNEVPFNRKNHFALCS